MSWALLSAANHLLLSPGTYLQLSPGGLPVAVPSAVGRGKRYILPGGKQVRGARAARAAIDRMILAEAQQAVVAYMMGGPQTTPLTMLPQPVAPIVDPLGEHPAFSRGA